MAYFRINGTDYLSYIEDGGLKFESNDVDSSDAGRTLDAVMHRGKVADKDKFSITCRPLKPAQLGDLLNLLKNNEYLSVETDVYPAEEVAYLTMYNSSRSASVLTIYEDGTPMWEDFKFTLIEQ